MEIIKSLYSTKGRINRLRFFKYSLMLNCIGLLITIGLASSLTFLICYGPSEFIGFLGEKGISVALVSIFDGSMAESMSETDDEFASMHGTIGLVFYIVIVLLPNLCLAVRRYHDIDPEPKTSITDADSVWRLFFAKGTDGPNQYGPDPLRS